MGKNFLQRQAEERRRWIMAAQIDEQRFCLDILTVALGRMGYGQKRLADFEKQFSAAYLEYDALRREDEKADKEGVYFKSVLDRELAQYCGSLFEPYEKRYGLGGGLNST